MKNLLTPLIFLFSLVIFSDTQAQVTGIVYRDYNGNGTRQTAAPTIEPGVEGVIINAYNAADVLISTTTSDAAGAYSFPYTVPVRVEFVLPASGNCVKSGIDKNSVSGDGNNVRFASSSPVTINYAVNNPADFINSTNPNLFVPHLTSGDP